MAKRSGAEESSPTKKARTGGPEQDAIIKDLKVNVEALSGVHDWQQHFASAARQLACAWQLNIAGIPHQFVELEAYFTCTKHDDPYTHGDPVQQECALFYFHRMGSGYKGGTYKGMDVSIGNSADEVGGLLVRSLLREDTGEVICGPCKCVDHIIALLKADSVQHLVDTKLNGDIRLGTTTKPLFVSPRATPLTFPVLGSPRVGLNMTKKGPSDHNQKDYLMRCGQGANNMTRSRFYRFIAQPSLPKVVKGRGLIAAAMHHAAISDVAAKMGITPGVFKGHVQKYEDGKKLKTADKFLKAKMSDSEAVVCFGALAAEGFEFS